MELADTSVWAKQHLLPPDEGAAFARRVEDGEIATCDLVKSELLYSARNLREFRDIRAEVDSLPFCTIGVGEWRRALDIYEQLAARGGAHHRQVPFGDLLVAAAAEAAGVGLLHYDADFDEIAELTGQVARPVLPIGTL